jgi:hypothetical protein
MSRHFVCTAGKPFLSIAIALRCHCFIVLVLHSFGLLLVVLVPTDNLNINLHFVADDPFYSKMTHLLCVHSSPLG